MVVQQQEHGNEDRSEDRPFCRAGAEEYVHQGYEDNEADAHGDPRKADAFQEICACNGGHGSQVGPGEQALELSAEETEAHVGTHGSHLLHNGLMDIHQSLKVSGGIAVGNACDDEQKEDNGDQAL